MKLSCDIVKDLLPLYVEDMISGSSAEAVREHLEACPACSRERETLESAAKETAVDEAESQKAPLMLLKKGCGWSGYSPCCAAALWRRAC